MLFRKSISLTSEDALRAVMALSLLSGQVRDEHPEFAASLIRTASALQPGRTLRIAPPLRTDDHASSMAAVATMMQGTDIINGKS